MKILKMIKQNGTIMNKCSIVYEMKNGTVDWKVNCLVDGGYNIEQTLRSYKEIKEYFANMFGVDIRKEKFMKTFRETDTK